MAILDRAASSNAAVGTGWTSPTNAYADDGTLATFAGANGTTWTTDYGFADFGSGDIPDGSTINSVTVSANVWVSSSSRGLAGILGRDSGVNGTETTTTSTSTSNVSTATLASATLADLRACSTTLYARVRCTRTASQGFTGSLDYVWITVDYTPPAAPVLCEPTAASLTLTASTPAVATPVLVQPAPVGGTYRSTVLADSPLRYWRLGEPSGTNAVDETGGGAGTYVNTPTLGATGLLTGDANTAVTFTRAQTEAMSAAALSLGDGPFAYEFWIKRGSLVSAEYGVIGAGGQTNSPIVWIATTGEPAYGNEHCLVFSPFSTGGSICASSVAINNQNTHHVVVNKPTVGNGSAAIWIDGTDVTTVPSGSGNATTSTSGSEGFYVAACRASEGNYFDGTLDEIAVYTHTLTSARISAHYAAGQGTLGLVVTVGTPTVSVTTGPILCEPTAASLTLTAGTPTVTAPAISQPTAAALTLSRGTPTVVAIGTYAGTPTAAGLTLSAGTPTVVAIGTYAGTPTAAGLTLSVGTPTVVAIGTYVGTPTAASLTLSVGTPTVSIGVAVLSEPTAASLTLSVGTPTVTAPAISAPTAASLTLTAGTPSVTASGGAVDAQPTTAALTLTAGTPSVQTTGGAVDSVPTAASLTLTAGTPAVEAIGTAVSLPTAAALTLSVGTPDVSTTAGALAVPTTAALTLTASTPAIGLTLHQLVEPTAAAISMTAFAPAVVLTDYQLASPTPASLVLTAVAPYLFVTGQRTEWLPQPGVGLAGFAAGEALIEVPGPGVAGAGQPLKGR